MSEAIRITNLRFSYPDGHNALNGINLNISSGESIALIGPNGAGKSTLILHLNGIILSNGAITILDKPVTANNLKWVRSKVGLVFQNPEDQLFSTTVFEDIAFGPINMGLNDNEINKRVKHALEEVDMVGYEKRPPHHLSWGEKKRIALATVLAMSPEILVADEPSSNLDPRAKWTLISLLKKLPMTKIIASHDLELVEAVCQRVVIINDGLVAADGPAKEILNNKMLLRTHGLAPPL